MKSEIADLFGSEKYVIAAVHFLPLPGSPEYDREGGMKKIIRQAKRDAQILVDNGVHTLLFTNEADMPYTLNYPVEAIAAFTAVVSEVMNGFSIPFGINVLVDALAALSVAHATGASYIRGLFAGCYASDMGIIENKGPQAFRLRSTLGSRRPYFFHNLSTIVGQALVSQTADSEAKNILKHLKVDGFTLPAEYFHTFSKVREVAPDTPLVVGSGTNFENWHSLLSVSDGMIIATTLREDEKLLNPVDPARTQKFMSAFREATK